MRVAGVDGCRAGWLVAIGEVDGNGEVGRPHLEVLPTFREILDLPADRVAIDIPIGLLDTFSPSGRECDREARKLLGPIRGTSVFSAPVRPVLRAPPWPAAMPAGVGLTLQGWAITGKIREVDDAMHPGMQDGGGLLPTVYETHPEVVFRDLNDGQAVLLPKRRRPGREERRALIERAFKSSWPDLAAPPGSKVDDLLDALACLWVAAAPDRLLRSLPVIPETPPRDSKGLRMEIWRRGSVQSRPED